MLNAFKQILNIVLSGAFNLPEEEGIVLGVIPARGGSRRIKKKNIKFLGGKPLIGWTIEVALKAQSLDYCLVSTDDPEIARVSRAWGAHVPFKRPAKISKDVDTRHVLVHALEWYEKKKGQKVEFVVCLQPTSPFRTAVDIDRCVQIAKAKKDADTVISVRQSREHPYWMFDLTPLQKLVSFMNVDLKGDNLVWQNLPQTFYPNGAVYVTRRDVLLTQGIYGRTIYSYMMPLERSVDLEEELDFLVCSALIPVLKEGKPLVKISWSE